LEALQNAHNKLDKSPSVEITIYTEDAEVGFPEREDIEEKNLEGILDLMPTSWVGSIPEMVWDDHTSMVAYSWLCKAMAIRLAERGVRFQLRTSILGIDKNRQEISFRGGGRIPSGVDSYDELHDFR
jgi:hypothetical protein